MYYFGEMPLHVYAPPPSAFTENHYCAYVAFLWYWLYYEICGVEFLSRRMCTHRPVHYIYGHACTHTHTHLHVSSTWHRPWHAHVTLYRYNANCHVHMHVGHMCHVLLHAAWPVCLPACAGSCLPACALHHLVQIQSPDPWLGWLSPLLAHDSCSTYM